MTNPLSPQVLKNIEDALRSLANAVRDLAAEQTTGSQAPPASPPPAGPSVVVPKSGEPEWVEQQIRDLVALMKGSPKPIGGAWSFLNLSADTPDGWMSFSQVHDGNQISKRRAQSQSDLGAFSKYVQEVRGTNGWPVESVLIGGVRHYRCSARMSEWIRDALIAVGKKQP